MLGACARNGIVGGLPRGAMGRYRDLPLPVHDRLSMLPFIADSALRPSGAGGALRAMGHHTPSGSGSGSRKPDRGAADMNRSGVRPETASGLRGKQICFQLFGAKSSVSRSINPGVSLSRGQKAGFSASYPNWPEMGIARSVLKSLQSKWF